MKYAISSFSNVNWSWLDIQKFDGFAIHPDHNPLFGNKSDLSAKLSIDVLARRVTMQMYVAGKPVSSSNDWSLATKRLEGCFFTRFGNDVLLACDMNADASFPFEKECGTPQLTLNFDIEGFGPAKKNAIQVAVRDSVHSHRTCTEKMRSQIIALMGGELIWVSER